MIAATGVLHHPRYRDIEGLDSFDGALFHSSRRDHDVRLDGARVGVLGTGSTGVQIVTAVVDRVGKLALFQRTPQWVLQIDNPPETEDERQRFREEPGALEARHRELSETFAEFSNTVVDADSEQMHMIEEACRANLDANVRDPAGFHVDGCMRPMEVVGRGGVRLDEVWAKRPAAHLSISIPEFPNLFVLNGPNGPVGNFSLIEVAELQRA